MVEVGYHLNPKFFPDECAGCWQATKKSVTLTGRMCQLLADNTKISHKRELVMLRYYNSLFSFSRDETYKGKERGFADYYCICKRIR